MLLLKTQSYGLKSYGFRAFSGCATQLWNALPQELRVCDSVGSFKKSLRDFSFPKGLLLSKPILTMKVCQRSVTIFCEILLSYIIFFKPIFNVFHRCEALVDS